MESENPIGDQPGGRMSITAVDEPRTDAAARAPSRPLGPPVPPSHLMLRLAVLALFLITMHAWLIAHFELNVRTLAVVEAFTAAIGFLLTFLRGSEKARLMTTSRRFLFAILHTSVLTVAWIVFIAAGSFISSVAVYAGGTLNVGTVALSTADGDLLGSKRLLNVNDHVRFVVITNPFGLPMSIETKGYRRFPFDLFPWAPKRVRVTEDLELSPSILLRVPNAKMEVLAGSKLRLTDAHGNVVAEQPTSNDISVILVGARRPIPDRFVESWQRQLSYARVSEQDVAGVIESWLSPTVIEPKQPIQVGSSLRASMIGPASTEIASQPFVVSSEPIQDIRLRTH